MHAVATHEPWAPVLMFAAGAMTSAGPCIAPRFVAAAGLASGGDRRSAFRLVCAFAAGLVVIYAAFGAVGSLLLRAANLSSAIDGALACGLAIAGGRSLWVGDEHSQHKHIGETKPMAAGAAFMLGASFALILSPCCTPLVIGIIAYAAGAGAPLAGSAMLACFALGHALPLAAAAIGAKHAAALLERYTMRRAASVVSGTLMLALAAYYGVLA
jgi:cytochrome c-type biogenesis protein